MDKKKFKEKFSEISQKNNFSQAFAGWFKESPECIVVLDLQKSNFGDYYELNIKIFVQGMFGNTYVMSKDLVKKATGDIFTRQPNNYSDVFDLDTSMENIQREQRLEELFRDFINPITEKALSREGLKQLDASGKLFLLPAIKSELLT